MVLYHILFYIQADKDFIEDSDNNSINQDNNN